jgi:hypothetical protein
VAIGRLDYQRPAIPRRPVRLAPRPAFLRGRDQLLENLHVRLTKAQGAEPKIVALCGLGGTGKTSAALEYAYRHLGEFGVVWQFAATDPAVLAAGFTELAGELGAAELFAAGDPVAQVHSALASRDGDWLLVFDNVPDPAAIRAVLPPAGGGRVVITTSSGLPGRRWKCAY